MLPPLVAVAALLALLVAGLALERRDAFTLGVVPLAPVVDLERGAEACQGPIDVPERFARVRVIAGSERGAQPSFDLRVLSASGGASLGRGRAEPGRRQRPSVSVGVGDVPAGRRVRVCVRNRGPSRLLLFGSNPLGSRSSETRIAGRPIDADLALVFERAEPEPLLAALPRMVERASLFHGGFATPWLYWVLGVAVVVGGPLLLARALAAASGGSGEGGVRGPAPQPAPEGRELAASNGHRSNSQGDGAREVGEAGRDGLGASDRHNGHAREAGAGEPPGAPRA